MSSGRRRRLLFGDFKEQLVSEDFSREVLRFLVGRELLSPEWAERLRTFRHTGFSVHSRVRAKTKTEAERVGKYMIRPLLSLERLSFLEPEGKVSYRYSQDGAERETMDYLEFVARVTVRYYGLYANAHRGKVRKASVSPLVLRMAEEEEKRVPSKGWAAMSPAGRSHDNFLVLDFDPRPGLSFFREGRQRFRAECGEGRPTQKSKIL